MPVANHYSGGVKLDSAGRVILPSSTKSLGQTLTDPGTLNQIGPAQKYWCAKLQTSLTQQAVIKV